MSVMIIGDDFGTLMEVYYFAQNFGQEYICKTCTVLLDLTNPDSQCALNHSGVLCGGCPPGLSLAIGSSRCLDCPDNNYLALQLVFIIAGIVQI